MRVNFNMLNVDMLNEIHLPNAPSLFRGVAEKVVALVTRTQFPNYHTMAQFDKQLTIEYWKQYDGLDKALSEPATFRQWFTEKATYPEYIRRARQWLVEHNYLIPKKAISDRAQEAGEKWRTAVKG